MAHTVRRPADRLRGARQLSRYTAVSIVTAALAQLGVAFAYGVLRWAPVPAVAFALAVSVLPAYYLNGRFVWSGAGTGGRQVLVFIALAVTGSAVTAATTLAAEHVGRTMSGNHATLTAVVTTTSAVTTIAIWVLRYFAFSRFVFVNRPADAVAVHAGSDTRLLSGVADGQLISVVPERL